MMMMMSLKTKDVFQVWKKWAKEQKRLGAKSSVLEAKEKAVSTKAEIKKVSECEEQSDDSASSTPALRLASLVANSALMSSTPPSSKLASLVAAAP